MVKNRHFSADMIAQIVGLINAGHTRREVAEFKGGCLPLVKYCTKSFREGGDTALLRPPQRSEGDFL